LDYDNVYTLDTEKFRSEYELKYIESNKYSSIGPIYSNITSVVRLADLKLLGKAISGTAYISFFKTLGSNMKARNHCPEGQDEKGFYYSRKNYNSVLSEVFSRSYKE
jgi:hypothetical protein